MNDLLEQFLIEGRELVEQAHADLARIALDRTDAGALDSAFRAIHTLKGSVALFEMDAAGRVLHGAEDLLQRARTSGGPLAETTVAALVACLDQTDRWIDELARDGALSDGAGRIAEELLGALGPAEREAETPAGGAAAWLDRFLDSPALRSVEGKLVAFRYAPDPDCFFRGDDPVAIVAAVPDLVLLSIEPVPGWPPGLAELEPFKCGIVLLGFSRASEAEVARAFRLVPDQVSIAPVEASRARPDPVHVDEEAARSVRVSATLLDRLADGVGELAVAMNAMTALASRAEQADPALAAGLRGVQSGIEKVAASVRDTVATMRRVPLQPVLRRLPRLVRETARALGKEAELEVTGDGLELDKHIADGLFEPLLHLVRNGVDHGLEPGPARIAAGKPARGRVSIAARREGEEIVIAVADDGRGIDTERLREGAVARGLIAPGKAEELTEEAALQLIFLPGFSTAANVSEVSGRGVGLDAVQAAVERMRGRIAMQSVPGQGTRFELRFPAQAITTPLLLVRAGGDTYGVPFDHVVETVSLDPARIVPLGQGRACVLRGRTVPVLGLAELLGGSPLTADAAKLLVMRAGAEMVAVQVDAFGTRLDARVRPRRGVLRGLSGVWGTTTTPDGGVLVVLDLPSLAA